MECSVKTKNGALPPLHVMVCRHRDTLLIFLLTYFKVLFVFLATAFSVHMVNLFQSLDTLCDGYVKSCRTL